jgi:hypothetical protein
LNEQNNDPGPSGAGDANLVYADLVGNSVTTLNPKTNTAPGGGGYYFNPSNFSNARLLALNTQSQIDPSVLAGQFTYGSFPRNSLRGPGFINTDLSVSKHLYFFGEGKMDMEIRADAFNVFNHANFANPNLTLDSPQFGVISSVVGASSTTNPTGPRIVQLALHLSF